MARMPSKTRFLHRPPCKPTRAWALMLLLPVCMAQALELRVRDPSGTPLVGVMLTRIPVVAARPEGSDDGYPMPGTRTAVEPSVTVFTDASGTARLPEAGSAPGESSLLARKTGYRDARLDDASAAGVAEVRMEPETDPAALAAALPSSHWLAQLDFDGNTVARQHYLRHCTQCHQGASGFIRVERSPEQWRDVMDRMNRYGAGLAHSQRKPFAEYLGRRFTELRGGVFPAPAATETAIPPAVITEWPVGDAASQLHDVLLHPNGLAYSGDNLMDRIYEIDPLGDAYTVYRLPHSADARPDGVLGNRLAGGVPKVDNLYGAHSLALSPSDGHIFITAPNQQALIEFDPLRKQFMEWRLQEGFQPQGIRFDAKDRAWFALSLSSKVGVFDRAARTFRYIDLPARGLLDSALIWYTQWSLGSGRGGELPRTDLVNSGVPLPYDLDIAADGTVWVTRVNADDIARIDPVSFAVEMIPTPFAGPRRIRCDAEGNVWITGFAEGVLARFHARERSFEVFPLPIAGETPYGLGMDTDRGRVWVTGSQSDAVFSFDTKSRQWRQYPLPRRGTYTRDISVAEDGSVYTTNSNFPGRHIEGAQPGLIRLVPGEAEGASR